MLRVYAHQYIQLGWRMADARVHWSLIEDEKDPNKITELNEMLREDLSALLKECQKISLKTVVLERRIKNLPTSPGEFDLLLETIEEELKERLFLYVPRHLTQYYDRASILSETARDAFPGPYAELMAAGNAVALDLPTASVFHSMRAAEIGIRSMATELGVTFGFPIELAQWGQIVADIEPKIQAIKQQPKSLRRDEDLAFYSEAASQFRYFNDGWRVRVSHARVSYNERQARRVLLATKEFFETLATRLREHP